MARTPRRYPLASWLHQKLWPKPLAGSTKLNQPNGSHVILSLSPTANTLPSLDCLHDSLMARYQGYKLIGGKLILELNENSPDAMPHL